MSKRWKSSAAVVATLVSVVGGLVISGVIPTTMASSATTTFTPVADSYVEVTHAAAR